MAKRPPLFDPDPAREVHDELDAHIALARDEFIAQGMNEADARRAAERRFGNVPAIARACRDIDERHHLRRRRARMWTDLRQDIGYALRMLRRAPGFTAVAVVTLALGIGGTTAIFSVIDAALLRPLPYPDPEQLVQIEVEESAGGQVFPVGPSLDDVKAWRGSRQLLSHIAIWRHMRPAVLDGHEPVRIEGMEVSEDYLPLHGVSPVIGRGFEPGDAADGAEPVLMIGHALWRSRFDGQRDVLGQVVRLDDRPYRIVGVVPASFYPGSAVLKPYRATPIMAPRRATGATVYGRLQIGVSAQQAQASLVEQTRERPLVGSDRQFHGVAVTSRYERETEWYRTTTNILATTVTIILVIACLNVAGLLLARGASRGPELAVRASLGAARSRIVRQLLAESLTLAAIGGAAGTLLAWLCLDWLVGQLPLRLPENAVPALNGTVFAFTIALSLLTGVLFGLVPALNLSRISLSAGASGLSGREGGGLTRRGGQVLIGCEVALAILLLAGAGLMIRSFARLVSVDLGFAAENVVFMRVAPVSTDPAVRARFYPQLVEAVRAIPGVEAAGAVDHVPLGGSSTGEGATVQGRRVGISARRFVPGYFEAVGFTLLSGHLPTASSASPHALVNESAARRLFGTSDVLGRTIEIDKIHYVVGGIVRDARHDGPLDPPEAEVFLPVSAQPGLRLPLVLVARSRLPAPVLTDQLREAATRVGPRVVIDRIETASDAFGSRVATPRQRMALLSLLAGIGQLVALVGIFGVTAYAVGRRTREIGIRMALGASSAAVVRATIRDAMWPVTTGIVVGLGLATYATKAIETFLFETRPLDVSTYMAVAATMALAALVAAWIPARRAAAVEVTLALRAL